MHVNAFVFALCVCTHIQGIRKRGMLDVMKTAADEMRKTDEGYDEIPTVSGHSIQASNTDKTGQVCACLQKNLEKMSFVRVLLERGTQICIEAVYFKVLHTDHASAHARQTYTGAAWHVKQQRAKQS